MEYIPGLDVFLQIQKFVEEEKNKTVTFNQQPINLIEEIKPFRIRVPKKHLYFKYADVSKVLKEVPVYYHEILSKILSFRSYKYKYTSLDFFIKEMKTGDCSSNTIWHWDGRDYNFSDPDRYVMFHSTPECKTEFIPNSFIYMYSENTEKGEFINKELNPYLDKINLKVTQIPAFTFVEYNSLNLHRATRAESDCTRLFMRLCESNHIQPRE